MINTRALCLALGLACTAPALADFGPYVGASIGSATLSDNVDTFDVDDDSNALRLTLGFQFSDTVGIEGGYHRFGTFEEDQGFDYRLDVDGFFLGGNVGAPLAPGFRLIGRGGFFFYDGDSILNGAIREQTDDGYFYFGGGAEVDLTPRFSLVGDWTRYALDDADSDVISIGFAYRF